jgi:hypothetical protein
MIILPKEYTIAKFKQYCGHPVKKGANWNGSCPICREGNHWLHKKRAYYLTDKNYIWCHNCSRSWQPLFWIAETSGMSITEIKEEMEREGYDFFEKDEEFVKYERVVDTLPQNPIDLSHETQMEYYKDNYTVQNALKVIKQRRMLTALGACEKYFISLEDKKYKNRIIIPYRNLDGDIIYYSGRSLYKAQSPKYLNKYGEKEIFNLNKVDRKFPYIFGFEGQIDSMFIINGVGISGTTLTGYQKEKIMSRFPNHQYIQVLDNQRIDDAAKIKMAKQVADDSESMFFIYPEEFAGDKDLNDHCVRNRLDSVDPERFLRGCKKGNTALFAL